MCDKCNGSGKIGHLFCTCAEGRFKKMMGEGKEKAEAKKQEEQKQKVSPEALKKEQKKKKNKPFVNVGDWVLISGTRKKLVDGTLCYVLEVDDDEVYVEAHRNNQGGKMGGKRWFDIEYIKPAPMAKDEDDLRAMIDLAIDTNDEVWFKELAAMLP